MSNANGAKWIRPVKRWAIYLRDGVACAYCGAGAEDGALLSLDHLTPRELGGGNEATNLVTCCHECNSARRSLSLKAWMLVLRDRGVDTTGLASRIRRQVQRPLDLGAAKTLLAARRGARD